MKSFIYGISAMALVAAASPAMADVFTVTGPEPIQTYTVCNHDALYRVNDRAVRLRSGGQSLTISGGTATVERSPDVFLQTSRLVRHSYQSLSASGACY